MIAISLIQAANQKFSVTVDGLAYEVALKTVDGMMAADVAVDGTIIMQGIRCTQQSPIMPYAYMAQSGNFYWYATDESPIWWEKFGVSQFLYFLTPEDLAEAAVANGS